MFKVVKKLAFVKKALREWQHSKKKISLRIHTACINLEQIQTQVAIGTPDSAILLAEKAAKQHLEEP